jgi:hypothetical protein
MAFTATHCPSSPEGDEQEVALEVVHTQLPRRPCSAARVIAAGLWGCLRSMLALGNVGPAAAKAEAASTNTSVTGQTIARSHVMRAINGPSGEAVAVACYL